MTDRAALWRFHAATGARVALHASVPLTGAFAVAIGMSPSPGATLSRLTAITVAERPPAAFVVLMTALAVGLSAWAVPRVASGADGWMRSLPVSRAARRHGLAAGIATAAAPLSVGVVTVLAAAAATHGVWNIARAAGLIPLMLGAAYVVLPVRRLLSAPLALCGAAVSISGGWVQVGMGALLVAAADLTSGGDPRPRSRSRARSASAAALPWRIALRASRSTIPSAWAVAALPLFATALFIANNDLPKALESLGARLGVASAVVISLATVADGLAVRRPPWPWARSLPWTSRKRIQDDALFLGAVALPILIAGGLIDLSSVIAFLALPLAATRAAAAMRGRSDRPTAVFMLIVIEGGLGALAFALMPWLALVGVAVTPLAIRAAARREAALDVGRWRPLAHLASGDPGSWQST